MQDKPSLLVALAGQLVATVPEFHENLGPGAVDHRTNSFRKSLRALSVEKFGTDYSEKEVVRQNLARPPRRRRGVQLSLATPGRPELRQGPWRDNCGGRGCPRPPGFSGPQQVAADSGLLRLEPWPAFQSGPWNMNRSAFAEASLCIL